MNEILKQLIILPYFTTGTLAQYFGNSKKANVYAHRWVKSGWIIRLKQGYYITKEYVEKLKNQGKIDQWKSYILTYIIYPNSYISLDTVLSQSQIIPEQSFSIGLVSKNKGIGTQNDIFDAYYHNIKEELFWGYRSIKEKSGDFPYRMAYPEKALIDWLWLKPIIWEKSWFEQLRLNLTKDLFDTKRFESYIKRCNSRKMTRILSFIKQLDDYGADR